MQAAATGCFNTWVAAPTQSIYERYDRFRNRVIFPIRDRRGRVLGFGGRLLGPGEPKYLNSPETPVYQKGQGVYGIYEARQADARPPQLIIVEGYMDVVMLAQAGITNVVATLGTAITEAQIQLLYRSVQRWYFALMETKRVARPLGVRWR